MSAAAAAVNEPPKAEHAELSAPEIPLSQIYSGGNIRELDQATLKELAESIKQQGVLEPVLLARGKIGPDRGGRPYVVVAGFRRVAAAKLAGLVTVPAQVKDLNSQEIAEARLVENLQREDLNPMEEARALKALLEETKLGQAEIGKRIGKSQPYVANRLRLLGLPDEGQKLVADGKVSTHVVAEILKLPEAAVTERNRLVRQVKDQIQKNGELSPREFRWTVNAAQRSYSDRLRRKKEVESAKFPACPVKGCGKKGRPEVSYAPSKLFHCGQGHRWDAKTGRVAPKEDRGYSYRPPPPPTLPKVDPKVLTALEPAQVARRLLDSIKSVQSIELRWHQGTRAQLELDVDLPGAKGAKIPEFEFVSGRKFLELSAADEYQQETDAARRNAAQARADLETWLGTFGRAKKAKGRAA